jgi:predicted CopG family antitoxin
MSGSPDIYRFFRTLNNCMRLKTLKMIAVSKENYLALKRLGSAGDSFNDVVTEVLKKVKEPLQTDIRVGRSSNQSATDSMKTASEGDSIHD